MNDFLVIGECVADIVRSPGHPDRTHPGGSPANVAYGLARLGRPTALLTQLGDDPTGELIGAHLRSAGVRVLTDGQPAAATPTAVVTLDERGHAHYDFDVRWTLAPVASLPAGVRHVHLGSIGASAEPGAAAALDAAVRLRPEATVSYDPNMRPALVGGHASALARAEACVEVSDLVKASDEDLAWLYPGEAPHTVAARWLERGPGVVFVTHGGEGAVAYTRDGAVSCAPVPTPVADTVGAGDAFMSAVLDALAGLGLVGRPGRDALAGTGRSTGGPGGPDAGVLAAVLRRAATAAALTVARPGANPPDRAELDAALV